MSIIPRREPRNLFYRESFTGLTTGTTNGAEIDCTNGGRLIIALGYDVATTGSLDINLEWNSQRDGGGNWTNSTANATAFGFCNNFNDGLIDNVDVDMDLTVTADGNYFFSCPVMGPLARLALVVASGTWGVDCEYMVVQGS